MSPDGTQHPLGSIVGKILNLGLINPLYLSTNLHDVEE